MKPRDQRHGNGAGAARQGARAFTLVELMISSFIFVLMVLAVIYAQIFGLRYDELTNSKLGADEQSRAAFNDLVYDIRTSKYWQVGNGSASSFAADTNAMSQSGNSIQLCANYSTATNGMIDTNGWIRYYFDTNNYFLCRMTNNGATNSSIVCSNLTNVMLFQGLNYNGSTQCDLAYKWVIATTLQFCEYQYPLTYVGANEYYNYYQIRFVIAPHNFDPPP
jgi:Tfp pilus assembly protein PilW